MKYRHYDQVFKDHAVNLWLASGKSAQEVAAELGIPAPEWFRSSGGIAV